MLDIVIDVIPSQELDYDRDRNGELQPVEFNALDNRDSAYDKIIFVVNDLYNDTDGKIIAGVAFTDRLAVVQDAFSNRTFAHELGHLLGLNHPFLAGDLDPENLMNYGIPIKDKLRFWQWLILNP